MERLTYDITAGDFGGAGAASRSLKQHLKRIGADAEAVRRAMIAAYEAEMNVVIHSEGGVLEATVTGDQVDVEVVDRGPGIPDVEQAMRDGFSTASSEARALGFGAGMGLPNIERTSDRLRVTSTVGAGTRVSFSILLGRQQSAGEPRWSLAVEPELCRDCRRCIVACPTSAVRVRDGVPGVLQHLCIDCTCCMAACPPRALTLQDAAGEPAGGTAVLVVPPAVLAGFHPYAAPTEALAALRELGYADVVVTDGYEQALRAAVGEHAAGDGQRLPVISPVCPAVVKLVELRFPALIPHLAPFASPLEAAQIELGETEAAYVVSCPSQRSALLTQRPVPQRSLLRPGALRDALLPLLAEGDGRGARSAESGEAPPTARATMAPGTAADGDGRAALVVTGASHVIDVLERLENGLLADVAAIEPYICDGGCFGSPLLGEDPYVAAWRWSAAPAASGPRSAHPRAMPYKPRPGIRLDADMAVAIRRLAELDEAIAALPGKDCAACGAPTCAAFAEDIVMGRATRALCPYVTPQKEGVA